MNRLIDYIRDGQTVKRQLFIAVFFAASSVQGADHSSSRWESVDAWVQEGRATALSIDRASIVVTPKGLLAWIKTMYVPGIRIAPEDKQDTWETASQELFDCTNRTMTTTAIHRYDISGQSIVSTVISEKDREMRPVPPNSIAEQLLEAACKNTRRKAK